MTIIPQLPPNPAKARASFSTPLGHLGASPGGQLKGG